MKYLLHYILIFFIIVSCKNDLDLSELDDAERKALYEKRIENLSDLQDKMHAVADEAMESVVFIGTESTVQGGLSPFDFFYAPGRGREYKREGLGSGVVFHKGGGFYYILTNHHVVADTDKIEVTIDHETFYEASLIGSDSMRDIAVIRIDTSDSLGVARLGDSSQLKTGDFVMAVGNPFGLSHSVTFGIVSALGRDNVGGNVQNITRMIQTDASINPGNSGGPLLNLYGEVVGINTMIYSQSGGNVGIGFAVPVNDVRNIAQQLVESGEVEYGWLGVYFQAVTDEDLEMLGADTDFGMLVTEVIDGGPAMDSGIRGGDILLTLNGVELHKSSDLVTVIANKMPGEVVSFEILRNGETLGVDVELGSRPDKIERME